MRVNCAPLREAEYDDFSLAEEVFAAVKAVDATPPRGEN